jgi:hypothetical protein
MKVSWGEIPDIWLVKYFGSGVVSETQVVEERWCLTVKWARAGKWTNTFLMTSNFSARGNGQNQTVRSPE